MLIIHKSIQNLFTVDSCSLKYKTPTIITKIEFIIVTIEIALDRNSYFSEKAHMTVAIK